MEDKDIVKRIQLLVDKSGLSTNSYAKKIGIYPQSLYKYLGGRLPSVELLQKILTAFPEISAEWLLMGEGKEKKQNIEFLEDQIRIKDEQIKALIEKI